MKTEITEKIVLYLLKLFLAINFVELIHLEIVSFIQKLPAKEYAIIMEGWSKGVLKVIMTLLAGIGGYTVYKEARKRKEEE